MITSRDPHFSKETLVKQELEKKFDVPLRYNTHHVIDAINAFVENVGAEVAQRTSRCKFVYHDDKAFSLMTRGATFRTVCFDDGRRANRHDYKEGAVNSPERVEVSWNGDLRGKDMPRALPNHLKTSFEEVREVARAHTIHEKWTLTFGRLKVEISYDRFYRDEDRTSLMFQELEVELESGLKKDFMAFVQELQDGLSATLCLEPVEVQKYWRVMHEHCSVKTLLSVMRHAFLAHRDHSHKPRKAFRYFDGLTPYGVHPCWGAMTILQEPKLPFLTRWHGALALALHDVLEDTTAKLPEGLPPHVVQLVQEMTFESYGAELDSWWKISNEAKLLKLYDKVSNLLDGTWMPKEKLNLYRFYTSQLADAVSKHYGELNIVKIARAICDKTV